MLSRRAATPLIGHVPFSYGIVCVSEGTPKLEIDDREPNPTPTRVKSDVPPQPRISLLYPSPRVRLPGIQSPPGRVTVRPGTGVDSRGQARGRHLRRPRRRRTVPRKRPASSMADAHG